MKINYYYCLFVGKKILLSQTHPIIIPRHMIISFPFQKFSSILELGLNLLKNKKVRKYSITLETNGQS